MWVASKVSEHEASCGSPESTASFGDARVSAAAATVTVFVSIEFRPRRGCVVVVWWWCVAARTRKFLVTVKKFFANPPSPMVTVARGSRRCDRHRRPRRPQAPPAQPRRPIRATCPTATRVCRQRPESRAPPSPSSPWRPPRMFLSSSSSSYFSTAAFDAPGIAQVWRPLFSSSSRARSHPGVEAQQSVGEKKKQKRRCQRCRSAVPDYTSRSNRVSLNGNNKSETIFFFCSLSRAPDPLLRLGLRRHRGIDALRQARERACHA